jgi:hypothetical protein
MKKAKDVRDQLLGLFERTEVLSLPPSFSPSPPTPTPFSTLLSSTIYRPPVSSLPYRGRSTAVSFRTRTPGTHACTRSHLLPISLSPSLSLPPSLPTSLSLSLSRSLSLPPSLSLSPSLPGPLPPSLPPFLTPHPTPSQVEIKSNSQDTAAIRKAVTSGYFYHTALLQVERGREKITERGREREKR